MYEKAVARAEAQRDSASTALEKLGRARLKVYDGDMRRFVRAFERVKHVDFSPLRSGDALGPEELPVGELQAISFGTVDALKTTVAAGGAGAASGAIAFGAAGALATASTGTAISTLSGAAAFNATLAWFGGGALAAGGGGMAAGAVVLGGIVAAPLLVVGGFVFHQVGKKKLEQAKAERAKVRAAVAKLAAMTTVTFGIEQRASQMRSLLTRLDRHFSPMVTWLEALVERETDYRIYSLEEQQELFVAVSLAVTMRRVLDVPLLDDSGAVNDESTVVVHEARKLLKDIPGQSAAATAA